MNKKVENILNGNTRIWWLEVLRREGVVTVLALLYFFGIAMPESSDRRELNNEYRTMALSLVKSSQTIVESQRSQESFTRGIQIDIDVVKATGAKQIEILEQQTKVLAAIAAKLGGEIGRASCRERV